MEIRVDEHTASPVLPESAGTDTGPVDSPTGSDSDTFLSGSTMVRWGAAALLLAIAVKFLRRRRG